VHTSTPPPVPPPVLTGLGQALRWLRERQARKQYRVADDAGVTKGMLSAYETGRQRPSLETLDKLLETLGCDLNDLHNALQIVNGRPERMKGWHLQGARAEMVELQDLSALRQAAPGLNGAADQALGGHGVRNAARPPSRQGPAYATMPGFGVLARPGGTDPGTQLAGEVREGGRDPLTSELYRLLGDGQSPTASLPALPAEEELALVQMLEGFHNLLRYWHRCLAALAPAPHEPPKPLDPPGGTSAPAAPSSEAGEGGGLGEKGTKGKHG